MNKKIGLYLSLPLFGTVLAFGTIAPAAGKAAGQPAQGADSIAAFWEKFKSAVIKGDKETVAALSRFPVWRGEAMGDVVYCWEKYEDHDCVRETDG